MNDGFKAFCLGFGAITLVGLLFNRSQRKCSEMAFDEGWMRGYWQAQRKPLEL
jgi:hypothetical protein